jgi:hypothetical protein
MERQIIARNNHAVLTGLEPIVNYAIVVGADYERPVELLSDLDNTFHIVV